MPKNKLFELKKLVNVTKRTSEQNLTVQPGII